MPNYTDNLELFKYDVEADKKSTFNIGLALNDNFDKIDAKVGEMETQQANIDLSNLSTTGNSKLNAKANIDLSNLSTTGEKRFEDINTQIAKTVLQSDLYDSNGHIKIDKMSFPYIKTKYVNGKSWYRIWSDGLIEQGGTISISATHHLYGQTTTFITPFKSKVMYINGKTIASNNNYVSNFGAYSHTLTSFNWSLMYHDAHDSRTTEICWYAYGY